ncbi:Fosfomycin resistance protein AbaF [Methylobacterium crusticola]|uniref:Fosfomycin resistance protein AbaF n=1 Tax=Methylobacterium crusticola TaxID=1697972 RepID=A0ABQ4RB29_9HYPH|nr:MFS transporter [Methylobacterium crusticola]GJD53917.1 Fosfomycin resistance protein AbaF [Methylobacterium crusticola]
MSRTYEAVGPGTLASRAGAATEPQESNDIRTVAVASAIGNMIEYYDFTLYATATALVFNKIFFPSSDPLVGSLLAFATFFVGYCARPLGGVLFGHFGDRVGRKTALLLTMVIMGLGTFLIGLMPTYGQVGVLAPICLIVLRLLQGIGIGGEYGGGMVMTVEHAPANRRGFYSSLVHVGVPAGFLIPIALLGLLSTTMSEADFLAWGWRIPFLFSIVLVGIGLFIRFKVSETPAFRRVLAEEGRAGVPVIEAVRHHSGNILFGIGAKVAESGLFNIYAVFVITYCVTKLGLPRQTILNGVLVGCALECLTLPLFGALSDRVGRRAVYVGGMLFQAVLALVFFRMLDTGQTSLVWLAIALGLAIGHGSVYGAQGAYFSELFPARIRYSGLSLVQQLGPILGGGLSPLVATALLAEYGSASWVAGYMVAMALLSAACTFGLRPLRAGT